MSDDESNYAHDIRVMVTLSGIVVVLSLLLMVGVLLVSTPWMILKLIGLVIALIAMLALWAFIIIRIKVDLINPILRWWRRRR